MGDKADIWLVDPHAEGDRRDDDNPFLAEKAVLVALAHRRLEACMIWQSVTAARLEPGRGLFDGPPG
jgi:hypothetical protein